MARLPDRVCLFVCSSDRTADVFAQVSPAFAIWWPSCPFARFVGLNSPTPATPGFVPVAAPVRGWREELLQQIAQLPSPYDYVLVFLDDFLLLSRVDQARLESLLAWAIERRLDYLRLVPIERVAIARTWEALRRDPAPVEPIGRTMPYYSSLQVALWKRAHLVETLGHPIQDIWEFEHLRIPGRVHYAVRGRAPIRYVHVVEKGRWQAYASRVFRAIGVPFEPGSRRTRPRSTLAWIAFKRLQFTVVGFGLLRVKRYLRTGVAPSARAGTARE